MFSVFFLSFLCSPQGDGFLKLNLILAIVFSVSFWNGLTHRCLWNLRQDVSPLEQHAVTAGTKEHISDKYVHTQTRTIKCGSLFRLCRKRNVFCQGHLRSPTLAALLLGGEKRVNLVTSIFNVFSSPAGPPAVDEPVAVGRGSCYYTFVSSPFISTEQWSLSLCSLLWWEEWACFFFSNGRIPSSSCIRRATSGERWSCLLPGGGGW